MVRISGSAIQAHHVLAAIAEYDRLGRDAFMAQYRFGDARSVFLTHMGRDYEAKAIIGVANGFATGTFVQGGDSEYKANDAQRVLRRLGIKVIVKPRPVEVRRVPEIQKVRQVPIETLATEQYTAASTARDEERRRTEGRLVTDYAAFLERLGHAVSADHQRQRWSSRHRSVRRDHA